MQTFSLMGGLHHCARCGVVLATALATSGTTAADFPPLRAGMWEFNRSVEGAAGGGAPSSFTSKKCTDPAADMKASNERMKQAGCKLSPTTQNGSTYSFSAECQIQGTAMKSESQLTVAGDSAYTVRIVSNANGRTTRETLSARRVGDC